VVNYWIIPGTEEHWSRGMEENTWGVNPENRSIENYKKLKKGDKFFKYINGKGIVAIGTATTDCYYVGKPETLENPWNWTFKFKIDKSFTPIKWQQLKNILNNSMRISQFKLSENEYKQILDLCK
jgi:hypothetical protein